LIQVIHAIPRQRFISIGADQKAPGEVAAAEGGIPPVHVIAMMLRALELDGSERVLDIPTGTGYRAAILSRLARDVVSVEEDEELASRAASTLVELGFHNVQVVRGAVLDGWPDRAPYQAIVVGAGATELPHALIDQLDVGGRLVIPLGDSEAQLIERLRKRLDGLDSETIGACRLDMLPSADRPPSSFPWARGSPRR
jgi:protein-L-isoaspartate(D-aspartate) O-methyltransferase